MMNPIYDYLENGAGVKLSIKTLSKRLDMKKKKNFFLFSSRFTN